MNVAVLGASDKPEKYSYQAAMLLREKGHRVFPVHPKIEEIEGIKVYRSVQDIPEPIDTISVYLSPEISSKITPELIAKAPRRMIFNPGAENPYLAVSAHTKGIQTLNACTLTMLRTGQF